MEMDRCVLTLFATLSIGWRNKCIDVPVVDMEAICGEEGEDGMVVTKPIHHHVVPKKDSKQ